MPDSADRNVQEEEGGGEDDDDDDDNGDGKEVEISLVQLDYFLHAGFSGSEP